MPEQRNESSAATPSGLFDDADLGEPKNDRERVLLAEIARLRKERDEAVESSHYYLAEYKRVSGDWVAAREFYLSHDDRIEDALKITPKGVDLGWNA